jgi:outer membrane protein, heavy metal efflux system
MAKVLTMPARSLTATGLFLSLSCVLGGCASVPSGGGFAEVEQTVSQRIGQRVQWNQDSQDDQRAAQAVHQLLASELTADSAEQIALLNNPRLQATYEELGIAQADLVQAGLLSNPVFSAEVRFPKYHALPFELNVMQDFVDLLMLPLRKRAGQLAFDAAKGRVTSEILNTASDVRSAFYRAQGAQQIVEMRRSVVQATGASFEAARQLHEAGNSSDLTFAQEQALYEQSKVELSKSEREALDAREELSALMGLWGKDIDWKLPPRLPDLPADEVDVSQLESLAIAQRTDLAAAKSEVAATAQQLGITRSVGPFGDVKAGAHLDKESEGPLTIGPAIEIPLPIFNQGQPAIAAATARLRQSERRYQSLAIEIRSQVRRARNRMTAAHDMAIHYQSVILPLRHQIVEQNQLQLNGMLTGIFQLLQAKQAEIDAGREYVQALQEYWLARCELEKAIGGRIKELSPQMDTDEHR